MFICYIYILVLPHCFNLINSSSLVRPSRLRTTYPFVISDSKNESVGLTSVKFFDITLRV